MNRSYKAEFVNILKISIFQILFFKLFLSKFKIFLKVHFMGYFADRVTEIHFPLSPIPRVTLIKESFRLKTYNSYLIRWARAYR